MRTQCLSWFLSWRKCNFIPWSQCINGAKKLLTPLNPHQPPKALCYRRKAKKLSARWNDQLTNKQRLFESLCQIQVPYSHITITMTRIFRFYVALIKFKARNLMTCADCAQQDYGANVAHCLTNKWGTDMAWHTLTAGGSRCSKKNVHEVQINHGDWPVRKQSLNKSYHMFREHFMSLT